MSAITPRTEVTVEMLKEFGWSNDVKDVFNEVLMIAGWKHKSDSIGELRDRLAGERSHPAATISMFKTIAPDMYQRMLGVPHASPAPRPPPAVAQPPPQPPLAVHPVAHPVAAQLGAPPRAGSPGPPVAPFRVLVFNLHAGGQQQKGDV